MNNEQSKSKKEISAGGVVYKKENDVVFVLLIKPAPSQRSPGETRWSFPKGHIEEGEEPENAALREVREEGGLAAKIVSGLGEIKYSFEWVGENISKTVHYFLMEYVSGDPANHDKEVEEARWHNINEVENKIYLPEDKEVFNKAKAILIKLMSLRGRQAEAI